MSTNSVNKRRTRNSTEPSPAKTPTDETRKEAAAVEQQEATKRLRTDTFASLYPVKPFPVASELKEVVENADPTLIKAFEALIREHETVRAQLNNALKIWIKAKPGAPPKKYPQQTKDTMARRKKTANVNFNRRRRWFQSILNNLTDHNFLEIAPSMTRAIETLRDKIQSGSVHTMDAVRAFIMDAIDEATIRADERTTKSAASYYQLVKQQCSMPEPPELKESLVKHQDPSEHAEDQPFRGAYYRKDKKKWRARITVGGRKIELGLYETEVEAAKAYDLAALQYHGEQAITNFPKEQYMNKDKDKGRGRK